jgi:hypothetical protein
MNPTQAGVTWRWNTFTVFARQDSVSEARASIGRYLDFYNPASEHPSGYVIDEKRFCWLGCDPVQGGEIATLRQLG